MGGEGDTLVKVGRGPKLTMFYGRSVSGRYGLGAPFCSFTQQQQQQQQPDNPKAKRPTIPVPEPRRPSPSPVPYRADKLGVRGSGSAVGVRSGVEGTVPPLGKSSEGDPHTESPAVLAARARARASSIPPHLQEKGSKHTRAHVKPTYLLRFFRRPSEAVTIFWFLFFLG